MALVYLIPSLLAEDGAGAIPACVREAIKDCRVFFVENERTTRRYFKSIWKEMVIDEYEWHVIGESSAPVFTRTLREGKTIGIVSEAGCPAVADPGQALVAIAQEEGAVIKPLTGPSSILLALMASGMNGQQFRFAGYLPIDSTERIKAIRDLENDSAKKNCTQIFIETPYRNNQLLEALLKNCRDETRICVAVDLTGSNEWVKTKTVAGWQKNKPDIHKRPAIFLLYAGH
jgi:16S rRNA (cytidine1402-2'-O)-methyltransferase